ncbi:hypothetical protein GOQ04_22655 [Emticicia sp. ODNR4P]|nr:hypothetical protein [Emticicia sp. ODNR4P]
MACCTSNQAGRPAELWGLGKDTLLLNEPNGNTCQTFPRELSKKQSMTDAE